MKRFLPTFIFLSCFVLGTQLPFAADAADDAQEFPDYSLVGIAQFDGISYACLIDNQTQEHFLLSTKTSNHGLSLIALTADGTNAIIQKEGQSIILPLDSSALLSSPIVMASAAAIPNPIMPHPPQPPHGNLPLLFQAVDPREIKWSPEQKNQIDQLRHSFIEELGPYPNPNDPEYEKHWKKAQRNADDTLRSLLGQQAFMDYQAGIVHAAFH